MYVVEIWYGHFLVENTNTVQAFHLHIWSTTRDSSNVLHDVFSTNCFSCTTLTTAETKANSIN